MAIMSEIERVYREQMQREQYNRLQSQAQMNHWQSSGLAQQLGSALLPAAPLQSSMPADNEPKQDKILLLLEEDE